MLKEPRTNVRYVSLKEASIIIGRSPDCGVQVNDPYASSTHAKLVKTDAGLFFLEDLGSSNGTFVNGRAVKEVYLKAGDHVTLGQTVITICDEKQDVEQAGGSDQTTIITNSFSGHRLPREVLQAFHQASKIVNQNTDLKTALKLILDHSLHLVGGDAGFIILKDEKKGGWRIAVQSGGNNDFGKYDDTLSLSDDGQEVKASPSLSVASAVLNTGQTYFESVINDQSKLGVQESIVLQKIQAVICVPLLFGKQRLGAIYIDRRGVTAQTRAPISDDQRHLLEAFGQLVTTAINNHRTRVELANEIRYRTDLQRYLSPQIVEQVLKGQQHLKLGGREITASVMFTDVRGFTKFSETLDPEALIQQLNEYFSLMTKIVFSFNGFLDKYIGDAMMVVFGVPEPKPDDGKRAVQAAITMQKKLVKINEDWTKRGWQSFEVGIGINTGRLISGNIGSTQRMEHTVLGDTVNVASRLCSVADPGQIVVSKSTIEDFKSDFTLKPIELPKLKGKEDACIEAFEVAIT